MSLKTVNIYQKKNLQKVILSKLKTNAYLLLCKIFFSNVNESSVFYSSQYFSNKFVTIIVFIIIGYMVTDLWINSAFIILRTARLVIKAYKSLIRVGRIPHSSVSFRQLPNCLVLVFFSQHNRLKTSIQVLCYIIKCLHLLFYSGSIPFWCCQHGH